MVLLLSQSRSTMKLVGHVHYKHGGNCIQIIESDIQSVSLFSEYVIGKCHRFQSFILCKSKMIRRAYHYLKKLTLVMQLISKFPLFF